MSIGIFSPRPALVKRVSPARWPHPGVRVISAVSQLARQAAVLRFSTAAVALDCPGARHRERSEFAADSHAVKAAQHVHVSGLHRPDGLCGHERRIRWPLSERAADPLRSKLGVGILRVLVPIRMTACAVV